MPQPTDWRTRIHACATATAHRHGARLVELDGLTVFAVPHADQYCVLLEYLGQSGRHDLAITFDAEELACIDERSPDGLGALIEARIAYEVARYFAAHGIEWRPADG